MHDSCQNSKPPRGLAKGTQAWDFAADAHQLKRYCAARNIDKHPSASGKVCTLQRRLRPYILSSTISRGAAVLSRRENLGMRRCGVPAP
jgi:hypothetical protein